MFKTWFLAAVKLALIGIMIIFGCTFVFNEGLKNLSAASDAFMIVGVFEALAAIFITILLSYVSVGIFRKAFKQPVAKETTDEK